MTLVCTLEVQDAGAGCMFSIEDRIRDGQRASVSDTVGRMLVQSQAALRRVRTRGAGFRDGLEARPLQKHFWVRNVPYALARPCKPLISQQIRPPLV